MSETLSTSPARVPRPEPTWLASSAPIALPRMPRIGAACACALSGSAEPIAPTDCWATGSTRTFQTSVVLTTHSARLQAAAVVTPDGKPVVSSSQWSASRTASDTLDCCAGVGVGSGDWATVLRARSRATSQLSGPSYGFISDWSWPKICVRSGS